MEDLTDVFYLSMVLIGVGSFLFGILPVAFSFGGTRSSPFFLSLILCLGAGVLLATSLVHMLTEVQEKLKLTAQLYFCAGFLALYTFDEISHYCLGSTNRHIHWAVEEQQSHHMKRQYGAANTSSENSPLLRTDEEKDFRFESRASQKLVSARCDQKELPQPSILDGYLNVRSEEPVQVVCPAEAGEQWTPNPAARTGLLVALLIHSVLEGISIGVQTKTSQILLILGAVMFHKVVLSFCLGLELRESKTLHLLSAILVFSMGSPIGIFLGMTVTSFENGLFGMDAELQAVAAGSLLYVATLEVLPRERARSGSRWRGAGIVQLAFVLLGFACIAAAHLLLGVSLMRAFGVENGVVVLIIGEALQKAVVVSDETKTGARDSVSNDSAVANGLQLINRIQFCSVVFHRNCFVIVEKLPKFKYNFIIFLNFDLFICEKMYCLFVPPIT